MQARVTVPPGHPSNPLSWGDMEDKFLDCAASAGLQAILAERAYFALASLKDATDVSTVLDQLRKPIRNNPNHPMGDLE